MSGSGATRTGVLTIMSRPQTAPFCWGRATCFRANAKACVSCPYATDCAKQVIENLRVINDTLSVGDLIVTTRAFLDKRGVHDVADVGDCEAKVRFAEKAPIRFDIETETHHRLNVLSVRARRIALTLLKSGIDMRADARRGTNSLRTLKLKPAYMAEVQDLLNAHPVFSRDMVRSVIAQRHSLKYSTLNNAVSFAVAAMQAMGFITCIGEGRYALN